MISNQALRIQQTAVGRRPEVLPTAVYMQSFVMKLFQQADTGHGAVGQNFGFDNK
jgi:hypothetical protein